MDFVDKKEKFADLIEEYVKDKDKENELFEYIEELKNDPEFDNKELFKNLFSEFVKFLPDLSDKELRQRVNMIRTYID